MEKVGENHYTITLPFSWNDLLCGPELVATFAEQDCDDLDLMWEVWRWSAKRWEVRRTFREGEQVEMPDGKWERFFRSKKAAVFFAKLRAGERPNV